jgi:DnaK suppressor protein
MAMQITTIAALETHRYRAILESKLEELLGFPLERDELQIEQMADPLDQVKSSVDRDLAVQQIDQQARLIRDIRSALTKIEEDSYGQCEHCEHAIPGKRLDVIPWARLCVSCQSEAETAGHVGKIASQDGARGPQLTFFGKRSNIAA